MIVETNTTRSIGGLANYLSFGRAENQNKVQNREERVAWESGRNLRGADSIETARRRFRRVAAHKARQVEAPLYQMILSWQSGNEEKGIPPDDPSREEMEWVVDELLSELGLEEHQAWLLAHHDTSTSHVHTAVNRIHPRTAETWEQPSYDQTLLYHTLRRIEEEKGWHRPGPMRIEDLDGDRRRGQEYWEEQAEKFGRERSVRRWAREEGIADLLKTAASWEQAEKILIGTEATFEPRRENGMVLKRGGGHAALSSIDPKISRRRLEDRYGQSWEEYSSAREVPSGRLRKRLSGGFSPAGKQIRAYRLAEKIAAIRQAESAQSESSGRNEEQAGPALRGRGKLAGEEQKARAALIGLAGRFWKAPLEEGDGLRELKDEIGGREAEILERARAHGAQWARFMTPTRKWDEAFGEGAYGKPAEGEPPQLEKLSRPGEPSDMEHVPPASTGEYLRRRLALRREAGPEATDRHRGDGDPAERSSGGRHAGARHSGANAARSRNSQDRISQVEIPSAAAMRKGSVADRIRSLDLQVCIGTEEKPPRERIEAHYERARGRLRRTCRDLLRESRKIRDLNGRLQEAREELEATLKKSGPDTAGESQSQAAELLEKTQKLLSRRREREGVARQLNQRRRRLAEQVREAETLLSGRTPSGKPLPGRSLASSKSHPDSKRVHPTPRPDQMTEGVWKRARRNAQVLVEEAQRLRDQATLNQALERALREARRDLPAEDFPEGLKPEEATEPDTAEVGFGDLPEIGTEERAERIRNRREEELARAVRARVRIEGPYFDRSEKPEIGEEEVKAGSETPWQDVEGEAVRTPLEAGVETRPLGARIAGKEQIQEDLERLNDLWEEGRRAKRELNVVKFRSRKARKKRQRLEEKREEAENEEAEAEYLDQIREQRREAPDVMEETRKIRGKIRGLDRRISRQFGREEGRGQRRLEGRSTETLQAFHRKMEAAQERRLHKIKEAVEKTRADNKALKRGAKKIKRLAKEGGTASAAGLQDLLSSKRKAKHVRERRLGKAWKVTRHRESELKAIEAVLRGRGALDPEEIGRRGRLERQLEIVDALSELEEDRRQIAELEAESMRALSREARPEKQEERFGLEPLARAKAAERLADRAGDCRGKLRGQAAEIREGISNLEDLSSLEDLGKAPDRGFDDPVRVRDDLREIARLSEAAEEAFGALYDRPEEGAKARRQFAKRAYREGPGPDTVSYELAERELKETPASFGRVGEAVEESLWPKARRAAQAERALAEKRAAFRKAHGAAPDDLVAIAIEESCRERLRQLQSAEVLPPEARRQAAASLRQEAEEKSAQLEKKFQETLARKYEDSDRALRAYRKNREAHGAEVARDVMRNPRFYDGDGQDFALPGRIQGAEAEEKLGKLARRLREERRRAESYARIEEVAERYLPSPVADRKSVKMKEGASQMERPSLRRLSIQSLSSQGDTLEPIGSAHGDREAARRFAQKTAAQAQAYKEVDEVLGLYQDAKRRRQIQDLSNEIEDVRRTSFRREQYRSLRATLSSEYDAEEGLPDAVSQVIAFEESPVDLVLELAGPEGSDALNEAVETIRQLRSVEGEPESLRVTEAGMKKENEVLLQAGRTAMKIDMMQGEEKSEQIMRQKKRGARLRQTTPTWEGEAEKIWDRTCRMSKESRELLEEKAQRDRAARDILKIAETRAENRPEEQRVSPRPEEPEGQQKSQDQQPEDQSEDEGQSRGYDRRRDSGIGL